MGKERIWQEGTAYHILPIFLLTADVEEYGRGWTFLHILKNYTKPRGCQPYTKGELRLKFHGLKVLTSLSNQNRHKLNPLIYGVTDGHVYQIKNRELLLMMNFLIPTTQGPQTIKPLNAWYRRFPQIPSIPLLHLHHQLFKETRSTFLQPCVVGWHFFLLFPSFSFLIFPLNFNPNIKIVTLWPMPLPHGKNIGCYIHSNINMPVPTFFAHKLCLEGSCGLV